MLKEGIFREYDIRGIAGEDLNREVAFLLGRAFGTLVKRANPQASWTSVGRDVRLSSEELTSGIIKGLTSTGLNVYDLEVCPTPLQYFSLFHLKYSLPLPSPLPNMIDGGVMVTGSHNPPEYNGFKLSIGKETIHGKDIQKIKEIILKQDWLLSEKEGKVKSYNILKAYKDYMLKEFSYLNNPEYKRLKVAIDAGNGTAGLVVPELLQNIGCEIIPLYCEPDGNFPHHHPDPTVVTNMQDMIGETKKQGADLGVGYDGDVDRIGIVDRGGNIVWGDQLMIILSREILKQYPGAKVIGDVKCSQLMFEEIEKHGGKPIIWKTGHSLVKQKMREEGVLLAGEFSGHIFISDRYFGYDDAIYATLRLVEIMKKKGMGINELLSDLPHTFFTPEIRIDYPEEKKKDIIERMVIRFKEYQKNSNSHYLIKDLNTIDGVRVVWENGWGLVRASNTQPVLVMRVEAKDEESLENYQAFLNEELSTLLRHSEQPPCHSEQPPCHSELVSESNPLCHSEPYPSCHSELVSESHNNNQFSLIEKPIKTTEMKE